MTDQPPAECGPACAEAHTYRGNECALSCREIGGGVADPSWTVPCSACGTMIGFPCYWGDGSASGVAHGKRWDAYDRAQKAANNRPAALPIRQRTLPERIRYHVRKLTERGTAGDGVDPFLVGHATDLALAADEAEATEAVLAAVRDVATAMDGVTGARFWAQQLHTALQPVQRTDQPRLPLSWCGASDVIDTGFFANPTQFGPCILRHGHDGPAHKDAKGREWWPNGDSVVTVPEPLTAEQVEAFRAEWERLHGRTKDDETENGS